MDQQLKERLVGAVVLMAAAVVFIPIILSGPREPEPPAPQAGPVPASAPVPQGFSSRIVPLGSRDRPRPVSMPAARPDPVPEREPEIARAPAARQSAANANANATAREPEPPAPSEPVTAASAAAPATAPAAPATAASAPPAAPAAPERATRAASDAGTRAGWVVQLGSFSNARNAYALRDRLASSGFAVFAESAGTGGDAVTRVFVGPEPDRERAERHVPRLFEQTRLKGIVVHRAGD